MAKSNSQKQKRSVFTLLSAAALAVVGVVSACAAACNLVAWIIESLMNDYIIQLSGIIYESGELLTTLLFALLAIVSAILVLVDKKGRLVLLPLGMMSFYFIISTVSSVLFVIYDFLQYQLGLGAMLRVSFPYVCLLTSLILAAILTAIFLFAAATFCKKNNKLLLIVLGGIYFLLFGYDAIAALLSIVFALGALLGNLEVAENPLTYLGSLLGLITDVVVKAFFTVGVLFAAFGIRKDKPVAAEEGPIEVEAVETEAVNTEAAEPATCDASAENKEA